MDRMAIKSFLLTLFLSLLITAVVFAQKGIHHDKGPGDPCNNMDFGTCDFTGWVLTQGEVDANPYSFINQVSTTNWGNGSVIGFPATVASSLIADQHFIVSPGMDPNAPIQMTSPFSGSGCTAMLGDGMNDKRHAARMHQTFLVTSANANFSYNYAAVLEDPSGHTLGEKPFFMARIYDQNGVSIACAEYQATAGDGSPGWVNTGNLQYKDWSTVMVPLQAYIGQNVTVEFTVGDCKQGGHAGYVYIEASCNPLQIVASDSILCGGPVTLTAPTPFNGNYVWHPGGQTTPSIQVNSPGVYSVDLITSPGCIVTLDVTIGSSASLTANFTTDTACVGFPTHFTDLSIPATFTSWGWDFNNDGIVDDTTQNPSYIFATSGYHSVKLSVSESGACSADTIINVYVSPLPIVDFNFTEACIGLPTAYSDASSGNGSSVNAWQWNFNGLASSTQQNPSYTFAQEGNYSTTLIVTNSIGCIDSVTKSITVYPLPEVAFGDPYAACSPACPVFTNTSTIKSGSIASYLWDFGDGSTSSDVIPSYCYNNLSNTAVDVYDITLTATSDKGCTASLTTPNLITVYPNPLADFSANPYVVDADNPNIDFTDLSEIASVWNWSFGDGNTSHEINPSHTYIDTGAFVVQLQIENIYGCTGIVEKKVFVKPTYAVWIPNVFTPDGDGLNDVFAIDGYGIAEVDLRIYDRWGVLVKHQIDAIDAINWDGYYHGALVQQDVYVYKIIATDVMGGSHDFVGRVTLIK